MFHFFLYSGILFIIISGIFIGAWTNGEQQRANYHSETKNHRDFRTSISIYSALIGTIFLLFSGLIWYLKH